LREKYGQETTAETESLSNAVGTVFTSNVLRWGAGSQMITINQRAKKIDEGSLIYVDTSISKRTEKFREVAIKKAVNDL
jgi:hypothetical protein